MNCSEVVTCRNRCLVLFTFILIGLVFYFFGINYEFRNTSNLRLIRTQNSIIVPGFSVYTPGCRIPEMDPFDQSIMKYLEKPTPFKCSKSAPLIESNQTSIWVVKEALQDYNITDESELNCCYTPFYRKSNMSLEKARQKNLDNLIDYQPNCYQFKESQNIYEEFIKVVCSVNGVEVYKDFHAFVVPKQKNKISTEKDHPDALSILIIGADAVSRLNFHRKMPRTRDLIRSMGAIEFFGYNKVQDNTFPNLVPVFTGYSVDELKDNCWKDNNQFFDDCPWIWKNFSSKNYYTAYGEDAFWMGTFNFFKKGFFNPPTDYYLRPFIQENEKTLGHSKLLNTNYCAGARFCSEVLLNYAYKFSVNMTLSNKKFWALFWEASLTHDFLNSPSNNDDIFYNLFRNLQKHVLNTTAIFFLSDHGMRWGDIRMTYQGRLEEHLPFLFVILPDWFKKKYSLAVRNMEHNTHLLTTHFDLHETLKDFLALDNLKPEILNARTEDGWAKRAMSLFLPVSIYRTCKSAGIMPTWCTCQRRKQVSVKDGKVLKAAKHAVSYINKMLTNYKECARLKLNKILSAHIEMEEDIINNTVDNIKSDYVIVMQTTPGFAKFEATLRHHLKTFEILGDISRINIYGSQSDCIFNYRLKLYCYCI